MTTRHVPASASATDSAPGLSVRTIQHPGWTEHFLTASARDCRPEEWQLRAARYLNEPGAVPLSGEVFGSLPFLKTLQDQWAGNSEVVCPWNYLAGRMTVGSGEGGYQLHAISGAKLEPLHYGDRVVGARLETLEAVHVWLADLRPTMLGVSEARQTEEVFEIAESALIQAGLDFHDVARTWFYLDRILDWYPDFNRVRTAYFQSRDIFGGIMPASTGVGAANADGAALLAKVYAVRPKSNAVTVSRVDSPMQCDAYKYGSAFSRAVEVEDGDSRSLFISGTASIEPGGKTVHVGDVAKQMELTLQVVEAILQHRGMTWGDTVRAIAYFRDETCVPLWYGLGAPFAALPVVATQCDVCRDDLLFEIELQAGVTRR